MPITPQQIQQAQGVQLAAAHDPSAQVRLIAGPGTGKSFSIEERVCWLLAQNVGPHAIAAISFTRASATELRNRIQAHCAQHGHAAADQVRVSTLHSLALRILRAAGLLQQYPADPLVLDGWELEDIFDAEFRQTNAIGKTRSEQIRREHEAFWSTGVWNPPNYVPSNPPITAAERQSFVMFHGPRTQTYSCVLPGEIVRQCLEHITAGTIDPVALTHMQHLIVDEYQDLNPVDQEFVEELIARGVRTFVAGDDDQSIYSFRYASPAGIQTFTARHAGCGNHNLTDCFRCSVGVTAAASALMAAFPDPQRIPKQLHSLYAGAVPVVNGVVHRWRFNTAALEADAIAESCAALIAQGLNPREILILLSNQRELLPGLGTALLARGVAFEPPRANTFADSEEGRLVLAIVRIVNDMYDYVAHRTILGLQPGVGVGTCNAIAGAVIAYGWNFRDLFYGQLPAQGLNTRQRTALNAGRVICAAIANWQRGDTLAQRVPDIATILQNVFDAAASQAWQTFAATLQPNMNLEELRDWLWADNDDQQMWVLNTVYTRLNQPIPMQAILPPRVRIMSMHGAKGLSARVVFIPGLEEELFPGPWRQPYPGLVLEAARLLYVSVTRARAACLASYANRRTMQGRSVRTVPSRFAPHLNGAFAHRANGLTVAEAIAIMGHINNL